MTPEGARGGEWAEDARIERHLSRPSGLRWDLGRHSLGECGGIRCGYCAEEGEKADPCENCGEDMAEAGRVKTDLGFYCPACYQLEYDRAYDKAKEG